MNQKAVCIIPARGGSKRIPRKNIREFFGKPMIAWSIEAALKSELFCDVVVSTDDPEIAATALSLGATVPFIRTADLSDDFAGTDAVFLDALKKMGKTSGYACCLYATAPFVQADDLRRGLGTMIESGATSAFSVTSYGHPIFRALKLDENGRLTMYWPENLSVRSQDLPKAWHDAGQFYWVDIKKYLIEGRIYSNDSRPVEMPSWRVQDIDSIEDWRRAEIIFAMLEKEKSSCESV